MFIILSLFIALPPTESEEPNDGQRGNRQHEDTIVQPFGRAFSELLRCFGTERTLCHQLVTRCQ